MKFFVDRVEGETVTLLSRDGQVLKVPLGQLPGAAEGDEVGLSFRLEGRAGRGRVEELQRRLGVEHEG